MPIKAVFGPNEKPGPRRPVDGKDQIYFVYFEGDPAVEGVEVPIYSVIVANVNGTPAVYLKTGTGPTDVQALGS